MSTSISLTNLSWHPSIPCFLLKFPNMTVMLDCAVDFSSLRHFWPHIYSLEDRFQLLPILTADADYYRVVGKQDNKPLVMIGALPQVHPIPVDNIDMRTVDVILVSNTKSLVALPFFTEGTGFVGQVFATEPTIQFGKLWMEELIEYFKRCNTDAFLQNNVPNDLADHLIKSSFRFAEIPAEWKKFYSKNTMEAALKRITPISFKHTMSILGLLQITCCGSGFAIGSCNWTLTYGQKKIAYMSASANRVSHVRTMDLRALKDSQSLILSSLSPNSDPPEKPLSMLISSMVETVKNGGNFLMPILPSGLIFDLIDLIAANLNQHGVAADVPIYFISPAAKKSLAFSSFNAEWLNDSHQSNIYRAEEPFNHSKLCNNGKLKIYDSILGKFSSEFRSPSIVFAGHPSLRIGDAATLIENWGSDENSTVFLTDPDYHPELVWKPFEHLAIKMLYRPVDVRINYSQLKNSILSDWKPTELFVPYEYISSENGEDNIDYLPVTALDYTECVSLSECSDEQSITIHRAIVEGIDIDDKNNDNEESFAQICGNLSGFDNEFELKPMKHNLIRPKYGGKVDVDKFRDALIERNIVFAEDHKDEHSIVFETMKPHGSVVISLNSARTRIRAENDEARRVLHQALASCLWKMP